MKNFSATWGIIIVADLLIVAPMFAIWSNIDPFAKGQGGSKVIIHFKRLLFNPNQK